MFFFGNHVTSLTLKLQTTINYETTKKHPTRRDSNGRIFNSLWITGYRLAMEIGISQTRISEIIKGKRRITADNVIQLSLYFNNSAKFWLGL